VLEATAKDSRLVSGQAWGEDNLVGRGAIMDFRSGGAHVITFNFNPLTATRIAATSDQAWNAINNWRAISPRHRPDSASLAVGAGAVSGAPR
jgi:hypothetical protein